MGERGMLPKFRPAAGAAGVRPSIRPVKPAPPPAPPRPKRPTSGFGPRAGEGSAPPTSYEEPAETEAFGDPETMDAAAGPEAAQVIAAARARDGVRPRSVEEIEDDDSWQRHAQSYEETPHGGRDDETRAREEDPGVAALRQQYAENAYGYEQTPHADEAYPPSTQGYVHERQPYAPQAYQPEPSYGGDLRTPYEALPSLETPRVSYPAPIEAQEDEPATRYGQRSGAAEPDDERFETRDALGRDARQKHESGARARSRVEDASWGPSPEASYVPAPLPAPPYASEPPRPDRRAERSDPPVPSLPNVEPAFPPPADPAFPVGVQPLRGAPGAAPAARDASTDPQMMQQQLMQQQLMQQQLMQQQLMQQQLIQQQLLAQQQQQQHPVAPTAPLPQNATNPQGSVPPAAQMAQASQPPAPLAHGLQTSVQPQGYVLPPSAMSPAIPPMRPTASAPLRVSGNAAQTVLTRAQSNEGLLGPGLRAAAKLGRLPWFVAGVTFGIAFMFFATGLVQRASSSPEPVAAPTARAVVTATAQPAQTVAQVAPAAPPMGIVTANAPVAPQPTVITPAALPQAPVYATTPAYAPAPPPTGYGNDVYGAAPVYPGRAPAPAAAPAPAPPRHQAQAPRYQPAPPRRPAAEAPAAPAAAAPEPAAPPAADLADLMNKALAP